MQFILIGLMLALVCTFVGRWVAQQKGRDASEGAMIGFLLGPFGVLVELLLPNIEAPKPKPRARMSRSGWQPPKDDGMEQEVTNWLRDDP